jgi:hypothetical protein
MTKKFSEQSRKASKNSRKFVDPHSPWQILISEKQEELQISTREMSARLGKAGFNVSHINIWCWLRNKQGYPGRSFTIEMNNILANCLQIPAAALAKALDQSRALSKDSLKDRGLHALRRIVAESTKKTWTKASLLAEIDSLS